MIGIMPTEGGTLGHHTQQESPATCSATRISQVLERPCLRERGGGPAWIQDRRVRYPEPSAEP
jgi:hypothetical protein